MITGGVNIGELIFGIFALFPQNFDDSGLMWFLANKLKSMATELDRENKLKDLGI